jgi:hypothetical protein
LRQKGARGHGILKDLDLLLLPNLMLGNEGKSVYEFVKAMLFLEKESRSV